MKVDLSGNVKAVGNVYLTTVRSPRGRALVRQTVTIEDEAPWRRGSGWGLLLSPRLVVTIGVWREALIPDGAQPDDVETEGEVREDVAEPIEIKEWVDARSPFARRLRSR